MTEDNGQFESLINNVTKDINNALKTNLNKYINVFNENNKVVAKLKENNHQHEDFATTISDHTVVVNKPMHETDPKSFYVKNTMIEKENSLRTNNDTLGKFASQISMTSDLKISADTSDIKKVKVSKYILINSYDRNWLVDKYRYKYAVKFQENKSQINRVPYYKNNPTVPFTKTNTYVGVPNQNGWVDKNGQVYEAYDSSLELGELLGYEEFQISIDQDANISNHFNDIYSISVTNVTIPSEMFHMLHHSININSSRTTNDFNYNYNFPYILCNIEEFSDLYDGTDTTIRQSFCQLQYHEYMKTPSGRGYIILKPVQKEKKIFYPTPLATLPTLNISLTKPNGELLNKSTDGNEIFSIDVSQMYYLKITTKKYFNKDAFFKGDFIRIKDFTIFKLLKLKVENTTDFEPRMITDAKVNELMAFINKKEGHEIYNTGSPNDDGYYNSFYVYTPGYFNDDIGEFVVDVELTDTLTSFNEYIKAENYEHTNLITNFKYGNILNMSLQNSISLTVEVFKHDASVINTVNVTKTLL